MAKIEITREWEGLYEGRLVLHIPYGNSKEYPFSDQPNPSDRRGRRSCREVDTVIRRDAKAESGIRLIDKETMRVIPKEEEASWRNDPNCFIHPYKPNSNNPPYLPPSVRGVRIKGHSINKEWREFIVLVDGKAIANFPHSTCPDHWDGFLTSKEDALEAARTRARAERDKWVKPKPDTENGLTGPRAFDDDLKEMAFRRFKRETEELLNKREIKTTGTSICGPGDAPKEPLDK